jgi:GTP-binding protein HflX
MNTETERAVIVGVHLPDVTEGEHQSSLAELSRLAETLGLNVIGRVSQRRSGLAKAAVLGSGKLLELARFTGGSGVVPTAARVKTKKQAYVSGQPAPEEVEEDEAAPDGEDEAGATGDDARFGGDDLAPLPPDERATLVLVDHDLSPSQARNLERAVDAEVMDRTMVILEIFRRHARSREAKLEVEIARLSYLAPRLRETGGGGDRQRGGVGGRGAGESAVELDRRKVRDRISELKRELEGLRVAEQTQRARRAGQSTVALVGYTNAGKSSLMRALTGSDVYVADKLFATLGTTVRALRPETQPRVLVSDTVGFIKKLPHELVASFRATLDAAVEAHLVLHVVDASDAAYPSQLEVTQEILEEIGASAPRWLVLNKIDRLDAEARERLMALHPDALQLSAKSAEDVRALRDRLVQFFERDLAEATLLVPYTRQRLRAEIFEHCRVLSEDHDEEGTRFVVRAEPHVIARLEEALSAP